MSKAVIAGLGIHKFGRFGDKPYTDIGLEAVIMALRDAAIEWPEVQAAYCGRMYLPPTTGVRILTQLGRTGIPIVDVEAACAAGGVALKEAQRAISSGEYDIVLALGVEKMPRGFMSPEAIYDHWECLVGLSQNPMYWALEAQRYMHDYGLTIEQLGKVSVKSHKNGALNPYAMHQKPMTLEEIINSRIINDPIRLFMLCSPDEGAAAAVVCSEKVARKLTAKPLTIEACALRTCKYPFAQPPAYTYGTAVMNRFVTALAGAEAYEAAGIGPEDIDVAEVQDGDAFNEIVAYEDLGFCKEGEGGHLIDEGVTEIGGRLPVNTRGGLIACGEPVGASHLGQVFEIGMQLRGEAGPRQVEGAKVGLAHVWGAGGNSAVTILKR